MRRAALLVATLAACGGSEPATPPAPTAPPPAAPPPVAPPPVAPEPSVPVDEASLYACTTASDCVIVSGVCGAAVAANVAHVAVVTAMQDELAARARCESPPTSIPPLPMRAECQAGRCVAVPDVMAES